MAPQIILITVLPFILLKNIKANKFEPANIILLPYNPVYNELSHPGINVLIAAIKTKIFLVRSLFNNGNNIDIQIIEEIYATVLS